MVYLVKYDGPWDIRQYIELEHSGPDNVILRNVKLLTGTNQVIVCWEGDTTGRVEVFQGRLRLNCNLRVEQ